MSEEHAETTLEPTPELVVRKPRGFATMSRERLLEICSKGGKAAHAYGVAHEFNSEEARAAGRKGGQAHTREHMRTIGIKGAEARHSASQES